MPYHTTGAFLLIHDRHSWLGLPGTNVCSIKEGHRLEEMDITVRVKLRSILKQYVKSESQDSFEMTLPHNASLEALILSLNIPLHLVGMAWINLERVEQPRVLADGDEVLLFPPMLAGG